jgi:hypothetical protein
MPYAPVDVFNAIWKSFQHRIRKAAPSKGTQPNETAELRAHVAQLRIILECHGAFTGYLALSPAELQAMAQQFTKDQAAQAYLTQMAVTAAPPQPFNVEAFLDGLRRRKISVGVAKKDLLVRPGGTSTLTDQDRHYLTTFKSEIVAHLTAPAEVF